MNGKASSEVSTAVICDESTITKIMSQSSFVVVFTCITGYLYFLGSAGLPLAHDSFDATSMRDTGSMMPYLLSQPFPLIAILKAAVAHIEGPLQYVVLNAYCFTIGNLLPLTPSTMQFPNTIFACVSAAFVFLIGRQFFSPRTAFLCTAVLALGPWLGVAIRKAWYFNTLSCMLHASTMYFFIRHMISPEEKFYRIAAPASLAVYIMTGLDWPCFIPSLLLFLCLSFSRSGRSLRPSLKGNTLNLVPLLSGAVFVTVSIVMTFKHGISGFDWSRVGHPFWVFVTSLKANNFATIVERTLLPWGPQMLLAYSGLFFYVLVMRKRLSLASVETAFLDSVCVWLVVASVATIASSGDATYLYVLALPSAILSGLAISRLSNAYAMVALVILGLFQVYVVTEKTFSLQVDKKQRVLAAACFLNEQRPDLLSEDTRPFVSGSDAVSVISYMRARTRSTVVPMSPAGSSESDPYGAHAFDFGIPRKFTSQSGEIRRPWFIIDSEALLKKNQARDFWLEMLEHSDIRWLARFKDEGESEILIGEFRKDGGVPAGQAPFLNVDSLSATYLQKYDRIDFLGNNVEFIYHY